MGEEARPVLKRTSSTIARPGERGGDGVSTVACPGARLSSATASPPTEWSSISRALSRDGEAAPTARRLSVAEGLALLAGRPGVDALRVSLMTNLLNGHDSFSPDGDWVGGRAGRGVSESSPDTGGSSVGPDVETTNSGASSDGSAYHDAALKIQAVYRGHVARVAALELQYTALHAAAMAGIRNTALDAFTPCVAVESPAARLEELEQGGAVQDTYDLKLLRRDGNSIKHETDGDEAVSRDATAGIDSDAGIDMDMDVDGDEPSAAALADAFPIGARVRVLSTGVEGTVSGTARGRVGVRCDGGSTVGVPARGVERVASLLAAATSQMDVLRAGAGGEDWDASLEAFLLQQGVNVVLASPLPPGPVPGEDGDGEADPYLPLLSTFARLRFAGDVDPPAAAAPRRGSERRRSSAACAACGKPPLPPGIAAVPPAPQPLNRFQSLALLTGGAAGTALLVRSAAVTILEELKVKAARHASCCCTAVPGDPSDAGIAPAPAPAAAVAAGRPRAGFVDRLYRPNFILPERARQANRRKLVKARERKLIQDDQTAYRGQITREEAKERRRLMHVQQACVVANNPFLGQMVGTARPPRRRVSSDGTGMGTLERLLMIDYDSKRGKLMDEERKGRGHLRQVWVNALARVLRARRKHAGTIAAARTMETQTAGEEAFAVAPAPSGSPRHPQGGAAMTRFCAPSLQAHPTPTATRPTPPPASPSPRAVPTTTCYPGVMEEGAHGEASPRLGMPRRSSEMKALQQGLCVAATSPRQHAPQLAPIETPTQMREEGEPAPVIAEPPAPSPSHKSAFSAATPSVASSRAGRRAPRSSKAGQRTARGARPSPSAAKAAPNSPAPSPTDTKFPFTTTSPTVPGSMLLPMRSAVGRPAGGGPTFGGGAAASGVGQLGGNAVKFQGRGALAYQGLGSGVSLALRIAHLDRTALAALGRVAEEEKHARVALARTHRPVVPAPKRVALRKLAPVRQPPKRPSARAPISEDQLRMLDAMKQDELQALQ
eukprot:TRINITY_DN3545_c0_g2_i1.p1 TRINITY_DN3545_c0_g2~~TRINITY_DN3545_c0_g2_i1.p1  ORF type:complete len:1008 (+),score=208.19 TRINITY_DN3545_c0_g2_i1:147-3170(+)